MVCKANALRDANVSATTSHTCQDLLPHFGRRRAATQGRVREVHAARQQRLRQVARRQKVPEREAVAPARKVEVVLRVRLQLLQHCARHPAQPKVYFVPQCFFIS